ncbi:unnamed protein product [Nesidiocoris tenuis]|uniref:Uncharacterized protein n=1 Tax=Nesidiocoris tenuis TaxID=355587 RepID=A0A6H5GJ13_9HEMI|nr:unnamed protein product [Nesidiocoris tenuis]
MKWLRSLCRQWRGRTTSSECSFQSDAEEGKCLLGPPRISSESDDDGMDLLNINEKVLRREYFGPPSLRNAESKRRISIDKPNYGYGNMVKDFGKSLGDSGLGQIDEDDNPATLEEPISLEQDRPVDQNLAVPKEMECTEEPEKLEECILLRLFPKSPKVCIYSFQKNQVKID